MEEKGRYNMENEESSGAELSLALKPDPALSLPWLGMKAQARRVKCAFCHFFGKENEKTISFV